MTAVAPPAPQRLRDRVLGSPLVDLLLGPHGVDRYLELLRPELVLGEARAEVVKVEHQTARSTTLTLRCNRAWAGHRAGQFVRAGFEIGGVRRTRTYSPAGSEHGPRDELELTVTSHPDGVVSRHLNAVLEPGAIVHLGAADGGFVLPAERPERLLLISGGSGITPILSMLRTLCDEGHDGQIVFLHYARSSADWLYAQELEALGRRHPSLGIHYRATQGPDAGPHLSPAGMAGVFPVSPGALAAVCGPPSLLDATRGAWAELGGERDRLLAETFTPLALSAPGQAAEGTLNFLRSDRRVEIDTGTLLEQAEAAGLSPDFGCRMGICHTCTCRKAAGAVRNLRTGAVSREEDEDIQLCVSVPAGDVALEL